MIVYQDDRRRALGDRLAEHLARVHERRVEDPARDQDVALQSVL
jgi:hypothetical protein